MRALVRLFLLAALASPAASQASWLDLADGLYDVTLSCVYSPAPVACPSSFHASLTISGSGASALSTTFNNQVFSGDPSEGTFTGIYGTDEYASLVDTPFSFFSLQYFSSGTGFPSLSDHSWEYCSNDGVACAPDTGGNWFATAVSPAPEPSTFALMALGLAGAAAARRRRSGSAPKSIVPAPGDFSPAA